MGLYSKDLIITLGLFPWLLFVCYNGLLFGINISVLSTLKFTRYLCEVIIMLPPHWQVLQHLHYHKNMGLPGSCVLFWVKARRIIPFSYILWIKYETQHTWQELLDTSRTLSYVLAWNVLSGSSRVFSTISIFIITSSRCLIKQNQCIASSNFLTDQRLKLLSAVLADVCNLLTVQRHH